MSEPRSWKPGPDEARARELDGYVGMLVFLGSWVMLFAGLLFVYGAIRLNAPAWPPADAPPLPRLLPALSTLVLIASSVALLRHRRRTALGLGALFIVLQILLLGSLAHAGLRFSGGDYGALVYTLTGFHLLHVLVGLGGLLVATRALGRGRAQPTRLWAMFWHFVDGVWLVLFLALFAGCSPTGPAVDRSLVLGGPGGRRVSPSTLEAGREAYLQYCRPCHGDAGDGRGLSGVGLRPAPRDFTQALFKFGWVPAPGLPPDAALARIIRGGLVGTAMLGWDLPDDQLDAVIQYIKLFSPRWRSERPAAEVAMSPDPFGPSRQAEAVALGESVYHVKAMCSSCHPSFITHQRLYELERAATGAGQTVFVPEMYESKPKVTEYCLEWTAGSAPSRECRLFERVLPPNFLFDRVRAGTTREALYHTIAAGIEGANMPTWKGVLSERDLWALVYYVKSLIDDRGTVAAYRRRARLMAPSNLAWVPPKSASLKTGATRAR